MHGVRISVAARSDVGRVRKNNEDSFTVTDLDSGTHLETGQGSLDLDLGERGVLLAVSDGMGGHQAGEVASALVVESLRTSLQAAEAGESIEQKISAAVRRANTDVVQAARTTQKQGMGATLTAVFVHATEAYVAEVGDSRAYLVRSGRLRQITRDQSMVQLMVEKGILSAEDAKHSSHKSVILQALGLADEVRVAIGRLRCRRGDRLLICCDGLSNALSDDDLKDLLSGNDPKTACDRMIALANERGGEDNLTAIVAHFDGAGLEPADPAETAEAVEVLQAFEPELGSTRGASAPAQQAPPAAAAPPPAKAEPAPPEKALSGRPPEAALPTPSPKGKRGWLLPIVLLGLALIVVLYLFSR